MKIEDILKQFQYFDRERADQLLPETIIALFLKELEEKRGRYFSY